VIPENVSGASIPLDTVMVHGLLFVNVAVIGAVYPSQIVYALPLIAAVAATTIEIVGLPVMSEA